MNGVVDNGGRALIALPIQSKSGTAKTNIEAWIDTGFTGDLVLPQSIVDALSLPISGTVDAVLADGSQTALNTYSCRITWFNKVRELEVVANNGQFSLLGVGLLLDHDLRISYCERTVVLD